MSFATGPHKSRGLVQDRCEAGLVCWIHIAGISALLMVKHGGGREE